MRARILIPAAFVVGAYLAACSKPSSESRQTNKPTAAAGGRHIELVEAPPPDAPLVSALEAGQALRPTLVRRATPKAVHSGLALTTTKALTGDAPLAATAPAPALSKTSVSTADAPRLLALAAAPEAMAPAAAVPTFGDGRSWRRDGANHPDQPAAGDRGPAIIIRGGRGGVDDRCDIHGPGGHGAVAINRVTPPLEGGGLVNDHTPRFGGGVRMGFPRGGIR